MRLGRNSMHTIVSVMLLTAGALLAAGRLLAQPDASQPAEHITRLCVIAFDRDARRPARVEDSAEPCLSKAMHALKAHPDQDLYLVGTADKVKDNNGGHGHARIEQDMSGEDLRYADVAAYRAINTKAYLVSWMGADPAHIIPLTTYEDGQWVALYLVAKDVPFKKLYSKETAPILARPCTVKPCPTGPEEFLLAQQRERIPAH